MTNRIEPRLRALEATAGPAFAAALERIWEDGDAVLPVDPGLPRHLRRELETSLGVGQPVPPGVAAVVTSSGSHGRPKAAQLEHVALQASVDASLARLGAAPGEPWLCCLPLHHVAGLLVLLRARRGGGRAIVHPGFDPDRVAQEGEAAHVSLVPTMLHRLLEAGVDLQRFRSILLGGAPAPETLLERAHDAGATLVQTYGMTETCGGCVYDGYPLDGVSVRIATDLIEISGPVLMRGYHRDPVLTEEVLSGGWLRTKDLGVLKPDGRLRVLGRADDIIVSGGEKIPAAALEALLVEHPHVREAAIVGEPDPEWGQRVVAFVVAEDEPPALAELRAFVADRAPAPWAPRELVLVLSLPRTSLGKIARHRLHREDYPADSDG